MRTFLFFFILIFGKCLNAQRIDTLELARQQANRGDFISAIQLLEGALQKQDVNTCRLIAQVLYWNKEFDRAKLILQNAIQIFPNEYVLFLDYGRLLYNTGSIRLAEKYLYRYSQYEPLDAETILMRSYIAFWQGDYKKSSDLLAVLLKRYPENSEALLLQEKLFVQRALNLQFLPQYQSDDQPLVSKAINIEAGIYRNRLLSPRLLVQTRRFLSEGVIYPVNRIEAGNTFQNNSAGFRLTLFGGAFLNAKETAPKFVGKVAIDQKFHRDWTASIISERIPYQNTLSAALLPFMFTNHTASLDWKKQDRWIGKASWNMQAFDDANQVYSIYGWLGVPMIFRPNFRLHTGYSFSWQHARENKAGYRLTTSLADVYNNGLKVPTIYESYFTPTNMTLHSGFTTFEWSANQIFSFTGRIAYALQAQADVPFFYVDRRGASYLLLRDYFQHKFHPFEVNAALKIRPKKYSELSAAYQYQSILFYNVETVQIHLKYQFHRAGQSKK